MAIPNVSFVEFQNMLGGSGSSSFSGMKKFHVGYSPAHSNSGSFSNRQYMELTDTRKKFESLLRPMFRDYVSRHPFRPTAKALANPMLMTIEKKRWYDRCHSYLRNNEKKVNPQMQWYDYWDFKSDSKPRRNARLGSSWVKDIVVTGPHSLSIKLGGKEYNYGYANPKALQQFITSPSLGSIIAKLRTLGAGSTISGLKKLY